MARQSYDLQLIRYNDGAWRAIFYTTGMEHSPTSATGTGSERTPWHAVQRAAWERSEPARSAARLESFRKLANSPVLGSMGDFVAHGDDDGDGPLDNLEQSHDCEPGVPGKVLSRMRLSSERTARSGTPTFHASSDTDTSVRWLPRRGCRSHRHPTSGAGHGLQRITAVGHPQAATLTISVSARTCGAHERISVKQRASPPGAPGST
jgi:hypothetical protein